ncbi:SPOSA6832_00516, partial [Sporobolomyces salmonicolor]
TSWKDFCTPACKVEIITPRLRALPSSSAPSPSDDSPEPDSRGIAHDCIRLCKGLRPVELGDNPRIFKIKNDRLVSSTQLYGEVNDPDDCLTYFTKGYIANQVPVLDSTGSHGNGRLRYVFAIEPRVGKDSKRMVEKKASYAGVRHDLDENGYIGNIAIELTATGTSASGYGTADIGVEPRLGEVFYYPTRDEFADVAEAVLSLSHIPPLPPSFWRQGIMSETIKAVLAFVFQDLGLPAAVVDPQAKNPSSIRLAEKAGFTYVQDKKSFAGTLQKVYRLTAEEWEKGRKKKKKKSKAKNVEAVVATEPGEGTEPEEAFETGRQKCCRWCQTPTSNATLGCSGCDWAAWCSPACKIADLTYRAGHAAACPGKGGSPEKAAAAVAREASIIIASCI